MDLEKIKVLTGLWNREESKEALAFREQAERLEQEAEIMEGLTRHPGWRLLDEFFTRKQNLINHELKTCKEEDLARLQEKAKIIDEFRAFIYSKIAKGSKNI